MDLGYETNPALGAADIPRSKHSGTLAYLNAFIEDADISTEGQKMSESLGNVLIIGGSGFVGTHCLRDVLKDDALDGRVFTINRSIPERAKQHQNVTYLKADLGDGPAVEQAINEAQPEVIIHLASPKPFIEPAAVYENANIQGIKTLLSACEKVGTVKAFVYCSSVSVIDNGSIQTLHGDESWPVLYHPYQREYYWHSKAIAETLVLGANGKNAQNMLTTALRVTSIFGEDDKQIIGGLIKQAKAGALNTQLGDGKKLNSWTYVGNVTDAHIHAAKRLLAEGNRSSPPADDERVGGEAFFITNDDPRPFWGFARQVAAEAGYPVSIDEVTVLPAWMAWVIGYVSEWVVWVQSFGKRKASMSRKTLRYAVCEQVFSMEKAKRILGWTPKVGIDEGIRRSVASFKEKSI